eukprot:Em0068g12a
MIKTKWKSIFKRDKGGAEDDKPEESSSSFQLPPLIDDPKKMEEILSEVDEQYKSETGVDCSQYELERLAPEISSSGLVQLEDRIYRLKQQDTAMYRKIYDLVFANYTAYVQELENVTMLQMSLQQAAKTCVNARRQLKHAKEGVSHGGLELLAKHRKRERLRAMLDTLQSLKTLQRTDSRLKELLEEGDYPKATVLCIECRNAIEQYKHYTCVCELATSLQDAQRNIEEKLEEALSEMCSNFVSQNYEKVHEAYRILGKTQTAVDTLLMKFTTTIHDMAYKVLGEHAKMGGTLPAEEAQQLKMPYRNLAKYITPDHFIQCLTKLCMAMWTVMHNYHLVKLWHEDVDAKKKTLRTGDSEEVDSSELSFNRTYVRQKLELGLQRVWSDVQQKIRPCLLGVEISRFKYDDFIRILAIVRRIIAIGLEFCGEGSEPLQDCMRQQSLQYFKTYHRGRLEELRLFLENEAWELCPVRANFSIYSLKEFRFMQKSPSSESSLKKAAVPSRTDTGSMFNRLKATDNPFGEVDDDDEGEDVMEASQFDEAGSDEETSSADTSASPSTSLASTPSHHHKTHSAPKGPILANPTLTVLRLFGNYMQIMTVLEPIAFDVLECLSQLFDYYLYAIYDVFARDMLSLEQIGIEISAKLSTTLKRIEDTLILSPQDPSTAPSVNSALKFPKPNVSPVADLKDPKTLHGLRYRVVAIESLVFLASQFETMVPTLESFIPDGKKSFLTQFVSHTVSTARELRKPAYCGVASYVLSRDQVLQTMSTVNWGIKDIRSQHSSYVDSMLQEFKKYRDQIGEIVKRIPIPPDVYSMLWDYSIKLATGCFVEGFSQATKRCSNEGRALMHLDFQQFRSKMEQLTGIRPLPHHQLVEDYVKAYYVPDEEAEKWLKDHTEYSVSQLKALVNCGFGTRANKKAKQRLLQIIDDMDKRK